MDEHFTKSVKINSPTLSTFDRSMWFISSAVILFAAFIALYYFWLVFSFSSESVISKNKLTALASINLHRGDPIVLVFDYCQYTRFDANMSGQIRQDDSKVFALPNVTRNLPLGCHIIDFYWGIVPLDLPNGTYTVDYRVTYQVNPLRTESFDYATQPFTVNN